MEILKEDLNFIVALILSMAAVILFSCLCACVAESFANFLYKLFAPIAKLFKNLFSSPRKRCAELEAKCNNLNAECERLTKELQNIKREKDNAYVRYKKNSEFQKSEHDREIGQVVTSEFNNIILSFWASKPLAPNVSLDHLTRLCNVPEANDRFFRALLQDFQIEKLKMVRDKNGKYNIAMKLKSGDKTYITTLTTCTCPDFRNRKEPKVCKHMYFLALTLGLISYEHYDNFHKFASELPEKKKSKLLKKNKQ